MNDLEEYFYFLDRLRETGVIYMFGAAPYLEKEFGLSLDEAGSILGKWIDFYSKEKSLSERVKEASK